MLIHPGIGHRHTATLVWPDHAIQSIAGEILARGQVSREPGSMACAHLFAVLLAFGCLPDEACQSTAIPGNQTAIWKVGDGSPGKCQACGTHHGQE